jgi:histone deacetylase complex regulatory component SIN3
MPVIPITQQQEPEPVLDVADALHYLDEMKQAVDEPTYARFVEIMVDFKHQSYVSSPLILPLLGVESDGIHVLVTHCTINRLTVPSVIEEVTALFNRTGHPELVQGFNIFLPAGWAM